MNDTELSEPLVCTNLHSHLIDTSKPYARFSLIFGILTTISVVIGTFGNLTCILGVLKRYDLGNRSLGITLTYLAFWDTVLLVSAWLYYGLETVWHCTNIGMKDFPVFSYLHLIFHPVTCVSYIASTFFVVAITIQRYRAVSTPLLRRTLSITYLGKAGRKFLNIPAWISLGAVLYGIPCFFEVRLQTCWDETNEQWSVQVRTTSVQETVSIFPIYRLVTDVIFVSVGPLVLILVLTLLIISKLRAARKDRDFLGMRRVSTADETLTSREQRQERITIVLLILLIGKFLLTHSLPTALSLLELKGHQSLHSKRELKFLTDLSNFLIVFNSATNCLAYLHGRQFMAGRRLLSSIFESSLFRSRTETGISLGTRSNHSDLQTLS